MKYDGKDASKCAKRGLRGDALNQDDQDEQNSRIFLKFYRGNPGVSCGAVGADDADKAKVIADEQSNGHKTIKLRMKVD